MYECMGVRNHAVAKVARGGWCGCFLCVCVNVLCVVCVYIHDFAA